MMLHRLLLLVLFLLLLLVLLLLLMVMFPGIFELVAGKGATGSTNEAVAHLMASIGSRCTAGYGTKDPAFLFRGMRWNRWWAGARVLLVAVIV